MDETENTRPAGKSELVVSVEIDGRCTEGSGVNMNGIANGPVYSWYCNKCHLRGKTVERNFQCHPGKTWVKLDEEGVRE